MKIRGMKKMQSLLKKIALEKPNEAARAIYLEAQIIMTESKRRCPTDTGILRSSGTVHLPEIRVEKGKKRISVLMSYGGAAQEYALAVHEHLSEHSPPSWIEAGDNINWSAAGTGPKFLEGPINEAMGGLAAKIAARVNLED